MFVSCIEIFSRQPNVISLSYLNLWLFWNLSYLSIDLSIDLRACNIDFQSGYTQFSIYGKIYGLQDLKICNVSTNNKCVQFICDLFPNYFIIFLAD